MSFFFKNEEKSSIYLFASISSAFVINYSCFLDNFNILITLISCTDNSKCKLLKEFSLKLKIRDNNNQTFMLLLISMTVVSITFAIFFNGSIGPVTQRFNYRSCRECSKLSNDSHNIKHWIWSKVLLDMPFKMYVCQVLMKACNWLKAYLFSDTGHL